MEFITKCDNNNNSSMIIKICEIIYKRVTPPFHQRTSHVRLTTFPNVETGARNVSGLPDVPHVPDVRETQRT